MPPSDPGTDPRRDPSARTADTAAGGASAAPPADPARAPAPDDVTPDAGVAARFVLDALRAGTWSGSLEDGSLRLCARGAALLGYPTADAAPVTFTALHAHIAESHRAGALDALREATRRGGDFELDVPLAAETAEPRWVRVRGEIVHAGGRPARSHGVLLDISEERTVSVHQRERERFLRIVTERLPQVVFVWDLADERLVFATRRLADVLGCTEDVLSSRLADGLAALVHPDDLVDRDERRAVILALADDALLPIQLRLRHGDDGAFRWYRLVVTPFARERDGRVRSLLATIEDVHDARERDHSRRARERELAHAQAIARVGSWTYRFATGALTWSPELYRIAGLDVVTTPPSQEALEALMEPADRARLQAAHTRALTEGGAVDERVELVRRDGRRVVLQVLSEVLRHDDDTPEAIVGTLQDITDAVRAREERERLEQQVRQTQKLESLGLLAGGIAHDFNNLLVGILSNASLALLDLDDRPPVRAVVEQIEQAAQRAADLTRQLLAYSGKGRFVTGPVDLGDLLRETSALLRTVIGRQVVLEEHLPAGRHVVVGDATQLRQVVMNLITNASDACGEAGGRITLSLERSGDRPPRRGAVTFGDEVADGGAVCLVVRDTGHGMTRETIDRIFDPFFSTKFTGRGLGLAATLGIVRGHRGAIEVWSAPGVGTEFVLRFPAETSMVPGRAQPEPTALSGHGHILLVDDDVVVRTVGRSLLARRGFDVDVVADGRSALAALEHAPGRYRLVLLDLTMPGLSGIETARAIRERERVAGDRALPIVLMSGYNEEEIGAASGALALSGFLQKPFTLADLDRVLGHALRAS